MPAKMSLIKLCLPMTAFFLILGGCATHPPLPPAQPIGNIASIAGTWKGTFIDGRGAESPATITITKDGEYKTERTGSTGSGKLSLNNGKAFTPGGSTITLHNSAGKQILQFSTPRGGSGEYTKVK